MAVDIHSSAIVDPRAVLGENVLIEAFTIVGPKAKIGDDSILRHIVRWMGMLKWGRTMRYFHML